MRILIATGIYPPEIGGPATFVPVLASDLIAQGHDVAVVTYGDEKTVSDRWVKEVVQRSGGLLIRYIRYALAVRRQVKRLQPHCLFLQGPVSEGVPAMMIAKCWRVPTLLKVVGDYAWEQYQQRVILPELPDVFLQSRHTGLVGLMERFERWVARSARRIIVPSEYLKTVVEAWGVSSDRIQVIYNSTQPLPLSEFSTEQLRETYHLEGKRVLLWYGRCVPWKNGDFLLRVLSRLSDEYRLVMIGDGPSLSLWKEKAEREGLIERVLFLGKQPRTVISAWLRVADAFVLPSLYEGFPHSVVEAVSYGVPVFVSDQCGNPETRQLFGDGVKVLSLEEQVWIEALTQDFSRMPEVDLSHSMRKMLDEYHDVLSRFYDKI